MNDCDTTITFAVGNINGPTVANVATTPASCESPNGGATITPAGYTYRWLHDNQVASSRTDLAAGSYQVEVTNPASPGCPNLIDVVISLENTLAANAVVNTAPTCGSDSCITIVYSVT